MHHLSLLYAVWLVIIVCTIWIICVDLVMQPILQYIKSLLAWKTIRSDAVYDYQENVVTGDRRIRRWSQSGYVPIDSEWVPGGVDVDTLRPNLKF